jgi:predicted MPP superfamily phosphohydrolase
MSQRERKTTLSRRLFLKWIAGIGVTVGSMAGYIRTVEPRWLTIERLELPISGLPSHLDGKKIVQMSDIHLSQYFSPERLANAIEKVAQLSPDWLVLTGDFVGNHAQDAVGLVEPLRSLPMPIYAVYGNHDYWSHNPTVTRFLGEANVNILRNASAQVADGLWFAGVDDLWSGRPDLTAAMRDIPSQTSTVLLAHEPDFFDIVLHENAPVALQLSGHSHGGQVRLPSSKPDPAGFYSYAPVLPQYGRRYPIGLRFIDGRYVYTNRGLGVWPLPLRFNCRPELTLVTLRSA